MSQAGIVDFIGTHPEIPTQFDADVGFAVPIGNVLEILGTSVAAGSIPVETTGSGNTITIEVQTTQEIPSSDATKIGLAAFDSVAFDVDSNGFVTLVGGGGATTNIDVDAFTAPGTDPVVPSGGNIVMTGAQVAAGTVGANVIRTASLAANTVTVQVQRATSSISTNSVNNGVSHFNSAEFNVDSNGFVSLSGSGLAIDSIGTQTGTNPITPTAAGLVTINGSVVAAGANPLRSNGTGANTMALEVQISQALAATDATKIGLCNFNSSHFSVDANGFVALAGAGQAIDSVGVDATSGGGTNPVLPTSAGLVTNNGAVVAAGTNPVRTVSTAVNVYQTQLQISQALAATDATKIGLSNFNSTNFSVDANGFVTALNTNNTRPAFIASTSAGALTDVTGDGTAYTVLFGTANFQYGSGYAVGTGAFTAPSTGFYQLNTNIQFTGLLVGHTTLYANFTTSGGAVYYFSAVNPFACADVAAGSYIASGSALVFLTAAQTVIVQISISGSTKTVDISTNSQFSGFLVC